MACAFDTAQRTQRRFSTCIQDQEALSKPLHAPRDPFPRQADDPSTKHLTSAPSVPQRQPQSHSADLRSRSQRANPTPQLATATNAIVNPAKSQNCILTSFFWHAGPLQCVVFTLPLAFVVDVGAAFTSPAVDLTFSSQVDLAMGGAVVGGGDGVVFF